MRVVYGLWSNGDVDDGNWAGADEYEKDERMTKQSRLSTLAISANAQFPETHSLFSLFVCQCVGVCSRGVVCVIALAGEASGKDGL